MSGNGIYKPFLSMFFIYYNNLKQFTDTSALTVSTATLARRSGTSGIAPSHDRRGESVN